MSLLLVIGVADALAQCGMGPRKHLFLNIGVGATGSLSNKGLRMNTYNVDLDFNNGGRLSVIGSLEFADNHYKQDAQSRTCTTLGWPEAWAIRS